MRVGSLFSGVGGFDLGLERAGMRVVWQVEYDTKARSVLRRHWPVIDLHEDVRDVGSDQLAPVDLVCGGFPCQDLSVAGKRAGLEGERSGLWFEFHRIVSELAPRWVLIENVPGLLSGCGCVMCRAAQRIVRIHKRARSRSGARECDLCSALKRMLASHTGRNMAVILHGLAELGYVGAWRVCDAQYHGVAQRRRRVFLLAGSNVGPLGALRVGNGNVSGGVPFVAFDHKASASRSMNPSDLSPTLEACGNKVPAVFRKAQKAHHADDCERWEDAEYANTLNGQGDTAGTVALTPQSLAIRGRAGVPTVEVGSDGKANALLSPSGGRGGTGTGAVIETVPRRLTPREAERLQGFPDDWTRWDAEGTELKDSPRYRMMGNAVAVPVAEWIGRRIMEAL